MLGRILKSLKTKKYFIYFFRMRALAWYARMVPVLLPLAQVMFKYSEHLLDSFLQYKLTNISKYSYTTKLTNITKYWWTWFSDWPHRFHLPHCGNRHRTLCHCMPPVFQGLTFWLLVSFVLIIVSLPVFVRICLYLSATPFQCMIWLLVIFSIVDYCIK